MSMSDTFKTTEDELNFILGNDVGPLFNIDAALVKDDEDLPVLSDAAPAVGAGADLQGETWLPTFAKPHPSVRKADDFDTTFTAADYEVMNDYFARDDLSSPSPAFALDENALGDALLSNIAFQESRAMNENSDQLLPAAKLAPLEGLEDFQDFNFDAVDDVHILASLQALNDFKNELFEPLTNLGQNSQNHYHLNFPQSLQEDLSLPTPSRTLAAKNVIAAAAAVIKAQSGPAPIVHPAHKSMAPPTKHSPRKRRVEAVTASINLPFKRATSTLRKRLDLRSLILQGQIDPAAAEVRANKARIARRRRRQFRAKSQAINLVGGGDVSEICRRAVEDSTKFEPQLLSEFSRTFNPKMYVDVTFDQVYTTMVETSHARDAAEAANVRSKERKIAASPQPTQTPSESRASSSASKKKKSPAKKAGRASAKAAIVTPPKKNASVLKSLPDGKDPESRHLRRLMRNRLSAQASRDRRKKAIEDAQHLKALKEAEINDLEKTLSEEAQRMQMLEMALCYARDYLGPDRYSKVAMATSMATTKATGGLDASIGANVIQSN